MRRILIGRRRRTRYGGGKHGSDDAKNDLRALESRTMLMLTPTPIPNCSRTRTLTLSLCAPHPNLRHCQRSMTSPAPPSLRLILPLPRLGPFLPQLLHPRHLNCLRLGLAIRRECTYATRSVSFRSRAWRGLRDALRSCTELRAWRD